MQQRINLSIAVLLFCFSLCFFPTGAYCAKIVRKAVWAGAFYPGSASELAQVIESYTRQAAPDAVQIPPGKCLRALILPHAGYRYSGFTAAHAAAVLRKDTFARVILMGPDHRVGFANGAISDVSAYETPFGQISVAKAAEALREGSMLFRSVPASDRQEHSLEVVLPFLQHYLGAFEMVPIVLGSRVDLAGICSAVSPLMDQDTLLVVSSDLSHYLPYDRALQQDRETIRMIMSLEEGQRLADRKNAACGLMPILVGLKMAGQNNWEPVFLNYTNSGDTAGSKDRVVGYSAIAFFGDEVMKKKKMTSKAYTKKQGEVLVQLARRTIAERLGRHGSGEDPLEKELNDSRFQEIRGTFVTLEKGGNLRGCIGTLTPTESVLEGVQRNAINAAFHDHRFPSLSAEEFDEIEIEVSILTAPQLLEYKDGVDLLTKLRPGIDGVIIKKGGARATFLPQVWSQLPEVEEFLNQLCMKAGLPIDAWMTNKLDVLTYQVQYFEEQKKNETHVFRVIIATGIASVVTQLLTLREFLVQFAGNEFVISLILFSWLMLGGVGTLAARLLVPRFVPATTFSLGFLSLLLAGLSPLQILAVRGLRDLFFIHGVSVGFYPTFLYIFSTVLPYTVLLGFVLPYSLYVLRSESPEYPAARVYMTDNLGDVAGGLLFSFVLVYLVTPIQAACIAGLPLVAAVFFFQAAPAGNHLVPHRRAGRFLRYAGTILALAIFAGALVFETPSLSRSDSRLVHYRETRYGRVAVYQDKEQITVFQDGLPVVSNRNPAAAEESVHYPLSQLSRVRHVLLVSVVSGMLSELAKYYPQTVDYVEIDPEVSDALFRFGMIRTIPGLRVIHQDARAFLAEGSKKYDAIIVTLPDPHTFQINRFYTDRFFALARARLTPGGVLSFSMQGYDNYLAETRRQAYSSVFNTLSAHFEHVMLLPGRTVYFLCREVALDVGIPELLEEKGIATEIIKTVFHGDLSVQRIAYLSSLMDPDTPKNYDNTPWLMRMMFAQWFTRFATSPLGFLLALSVLALIYLSGLKKEEFLLFSTAWVTMGSEIIVIFAFQIYFGYIYHQIGLIVTVFLAGLLPGAWLGEHLQCPSRKVLVATECMLIGLMGFLALALGFWGDRVPVGFYTGFGFLISFACGCQFPAALRLRGGDDRSAAGAFSADLMGAACGILITSVAMIPYLGITGTICGLAVLKALSLVIAVTGHGKNKQTSFPLL